MMLKSAILLTVTVAELDDVALLQTSKSSPKSRVHTKHYHPKPYDYQVEDLQTSLQNVAGSSSPANASQIVESLAQRVVNGGVKIDDATKDALNGMKATLTTSEDLIKESHQEAQELRGSAATDVADCQTTFTESSADDALVGAQVESTSSSHKVCRDALKVFSVDKKTKCDKVTTFINNLQPPNCNKPDGSGMDAYFDGMQSHIDTNRGTWTQLSEDCTAAEAAMASKDEECDGIQGSFETEFCSFRVDLYTSCSEYVGCYNHGKSTFDLLMATTATGAETRKIEWTAIQKIKCYIDILVNPDDDENDDRQTALAACQADVDTSHLDLDDATLVGRQTCDLSPVANYPCTDTFTATRYSDMVGLLTCQACPALPGHLDVDAGHVCSTVKDSPEGWSNSKHASKDGVDYIGAFDHGQKSVTKVVTLLPGVNYKWSVVMDTYATVDWEEMFIKAGDEKFTIPTRGPWACADGWTQHPKGFGTLVGVGYSANAAGIDCWRKVEQIITAPASGKVALEMSMQIDQEVNNEGWGFHSMEFEPVECPSPPTPAQGSVDMTAGFHDPSVSINSEGQIVGTAGGWGKGSTFGKWINAGDGIRGVEFKCATATSHIIAGITSKDFKANNNIYNHIDFGFTCRGGWGGARTPEVYESANHRFMGNQASGYENDVMSVAVNGAGKVEYAQNGQVFYTSFTPVKYPWRFALDIYVASNPQITDLKYVK